VQHIDVRFYLISLPFQNSIKLDSLFPINQFSTVFNIQSFQLRRVMRDQSITKLLLNWSISTQIEDMERYEA